MIFAYKRGILGLGEGMRSECHCSLPLQPLLSYTTHWAERKVECVYSIFPFCVYLCWILHCCILLLCYSIIKMWTVFSCPTSWNPYLIKHTPQKKPHVLQDTKKSWGTYKRLLTNGQNQSSRYRNMSTFDSYGWKKKKQIAWKIKMVAKWPT